jgi:hypothetical protein
MPDINTNPPPSSVLANNRRLDDARWSALERSIVQRWDAHSDVHTALDKLLDEREREGRANLKQALDGLARLMDERYTAERKLWEERWISHRHEHDLMQMAITKAETSVNQRLESCDVTVATLNSQRATLIDRDQLDERSKQMQIQVDGVNSKLSVVALGESAMHGKGIGQGMILAGFVIVANMILTAIGLVISIYHLAK